MDTPPAVDFKWFGEGFTGFPKTLPEDVVEYLILMIDTTLSDVQVRERLQAFQRALHTLERKFLKEYIWQRDPIALNLVREHGRWMLKGRTNYGDSVADEWLVVWLLRELSKEFQDAWIRICDTDGEFLLIEAANALPNWLNPEVADHRVWVHNYHLLVIPLSKVQNPGPLTLNEAVRIVTNTPGRPQIYPKVEAEAFHRLKGYPAAISENQHHATLPLPKKVAHILHTDPSYIAPVVEAFYLRDPISLRLLQPGKSQVPLIFPPENFVDVSVRFTKVLFAQLLGQTWAPPEPWDSALESRVVKHGEASRGKAELGIKVAAGLEMLVQHSIYADKKPVREIKLLLEDVDTGDDPLPTDEDIEAWPKREDDERWLEINFEDFERELAGKGGGHAGLAGFDTVNGSTGAVGGNGGRPDEKTGFGDKAAQENLRKMVSRFNAFIADEDTGIDGAGGPDPMDVDDDSDETRRWEDPEDSDDDGRQESTKKGKNAKVGAKDSHEDNAEEDASDDSADDEYADAEFVEYEKALEQFMALSSAEKSALTDDARELARAEEAEQEEDEEIKKLGEMMEAELLGHGALDLTGSVGKEDGKAMMKATKMSHVKGKGKANPENVAGEGNDDDGDAEYLDEDYNLADNMLKAFKSQAGMAGPAGNLMGFLGVQFPLDADDERLTSKDGK